MLRFVIDLGALAVFALGGSDLEAHLLAVGDELGAVLELLVVLAEDVRDGGVREEAVEEAVRLKEKGVVTEVIQ